VSLSTPARLNPLRALRQVNATPAHVPLTQRVLLVEFVSSDGRSWQAVGGGNTRAAAIAFARDSCPTGVRWEPVRWSALYGD
jgi:xanthine/CO dehydrogenase XdhC/CoxF family maturation factor